MISASYFKKHFEEILHIKNLIENDQKISTGSEMLFRLTFPIIEEIGFFMLGKKSFNKNGNIKSGECIKKALVESGFTKDESDILCFVFRNGLLHSTVPKIKYKGKYVSWNKTLHRTSEPIRFDEYTIYCNSVSLVEYFLRPSITKRIELYFNSDSTAYSEALSYFDIDNADFGNLK